MQGFGSTGKNADFNYVNPDETITLIMSFQIRTFLSLRRTFCISLKGCLSRQGLRFEYINTTVEGYHGTIYKDLAGNMIDKTRTDENRNNARQFLLAGIGISYRPTPFMDFYSNVSQNYRSITFSGMRIANPSSEVDPNLHDEKGYSFDLGVPSEQTTFFNYDVSLLYLNYNNRIARFNPMMPTIE